MFGHEVQYRGILHDRIRAFEHKDLAFISFFRSPLSRTISLYGHYKRQYSKKKQDCPEGCLSIPGRRDTLSSRAYAILVEYDTPDASHEIEMVEDFTAVVFQHEIDHLNGILYLDHLKQEVKDAEGLMTLDTLSN